MSEINLSLNLNVRFNKVSHQLIAAAILCLLASIVIFYAITQANEVGREFEIGPKTDLTEIEF